MRESERDVCAKTKGRKRRKERSGGKYSCILLLKKETWVFGYDRKVWLQNVGICVNIYKVCALFCVCAMYMLCVLLDLAKKKPFFSVNQWGKSSKLYAFLRKERLLVFSWDELGGFVLILYYKRVTITMEWIVRYLPLPFFNKKKLRWNSHYMVIPCENANNICFY